MIHETPKEPKWEDDWEFDDDEDDNMDLDCPKCNREYDEIDYEYQICHRCGFNNNKPKEDENP